MNEQLLENVAMIATALTALGGMITGFIALKSQKKKQLSEASESIAEAAKTLIEPLRDRVLHLESENSELQKKSERIEQEMFSVKKELVEFKDGTERLIYQLKALSVTPVWNPFQREDDD